MLKSEIKVHKSFSKSIFRFLDDVIFWQITPVQISQKIWENFQKNDFLDPF